MSLMLTAVFASITPANAKIGGPIAGTPAPMPLCVPGDTRCKPGPIWPSANGTPAPMPLCVPGDPNCKRGSIWPSN
jgi:hypothetical protein